MAQRVTIVTGASSGVGLATARRLAARGGALVLAARRAGPLEAAAAGLDAETLAAPTDMGDGASVDALADRALERFGRIDAIVNNAGTAPLVPIAETSWDLLQRTLAVNAAGPVRLIARAWPAFVRAGAGRVVNVSSVATLDPFPGFLAYGASKGALEIATKCVNNARSEPGAPDVRAFTVCPGAVETPMLRSIADEAALPPSACLDPDDVARVIVECLEGGRDGESSSRIVVRRADDGGVSVEAAPS